MTKIELVRGEMMQAMKSGDKKRKDALSLLLAALKKKQIDKQAELTQEEENEVVYKEIKEAHETIDTTPISRPDVIDNCKFIISVYSEFAPALMEEAQIRDVITGVLTELSIAAPTAKDKGRIMKSLMPLVKGKADGKLVNDILSGMFVNP